MQEEVKRATRKFWGLSPGSPAGSSKQEHYWPDSFLGLTDENARAKPAAKENAECTDIVRSRKAR